MTVSLFSFSLSLHASTSAIGKVNPFCIPSLSLHLHQSTLPVIFINRSVSIELLLLHLSLTAFLALTSWLQIALYLCLLPYFPPPPPFLQLLLNQVFPCP